MSRYSVSVQYGNSTSVDPKSVLFSFAMEDATLFPTLLTVLTAFKTGFTALLFFYKDRLS